MSRGVQQSLFFLGLPDRNKLCSVTLSLQDEEEEPRSKQIKSCRELVLLYSDILASPALDSFTDITVVMAIPLFQRGILQVFGQRHRLQLGSPQCVFPGVLQCCLSYSLITRLAPRWNKAGLFLVAGKDFVTESGRLHAVSMELSTSEGQLCLGVEASTVRLPPTRLEDFDLPPLVLRRFCSDPESVLDPSSTGRALWCHVLPSMKKGQIITISRQLPRDGPFRTYRELQNHWNRLYGYRLPDLTEEEVVYCSIYFRLVGERLFTYPLSCVRLQPVQRCAGLQEALGSFLSDVGDELQSVCGFQARLTCKPRQQAAGLSSATTGLRGEQASSSSSSSSSRPSLSFSVSSGYQSAPSLSSSSSLPLLQPGSSHTSSSSSSLRLSLPASFTSSSSSSLRLLQPTSSSSSSSSPPLSQSASSFTSSSSSSSLPLLQPASSFTSSSSSSSLPLLQPASSFTSSSSSSSLPLLQPASSFTSSSSSSSLPLLQPASSFTSSSSSSSLPLLQPASSFTSSSCSLPLLQSASFFTSSSSSSSLPLLQSASFFTSSSSSLPLLQPASSFTSSSSSLPLLQSASFFTSSSSSLPLLQPASSFTTSSSSSLPPLPPPPPPVLPAPKLVPIFLNKCPSRHVNVALLRAQREQQGGGGGEERGRVTLPTFGKATPTSSSSSSVSSLSSVSLPLPPPRTVPRFGRQPKPAHPRLRHVPSLRPGLLLTPKPKPGSSPGTTGESRKTRPPRPPTPPELCRKTSSSSSRGGVVFESKPKKSRSAVRDVDVEQMARNNQLSRLNSATLLAWLRGRGALVTAKHKKEELMLKVMGRLAEA